MLVVTIKPHALIVRIVLFSSLLSHHLAVHTNGQTRSSAGHSAGTVIVLVVIVLVGVGVAADSKVSCPAHGYQIADARASQHMPGLLGQRVDSLAQIVDATTDESVE
jgi:hypothetical protein